MDALLFRPLVAEGLTTLRVRHDFRAGTGQVEAAREWDEGLDFGGYGRAFTFESLLTREPAVLGDEETRALFRRHGAGDLLDLLLAHMAAGRHEGVDVWVHAPRGIGLVSNMHSSAPGLGSRRHALRAGGIRRHGPEEPIEAVLVDGLNLSRAMSYKNAGARVPFGGSKICVVSEPIATGDDEALGFLAWGIDRARCFTGPDMGFSPEHADALRRRFTRNIVGGTAEALGPTGPPTARGVLLALVEAVRERLGRDGLGGLTFAVQGLGAVGAPLASGLLAGGAVRVFVADVDAARVESFLSSLESGDRGRVEVAGPDEVLFLDVDVASPNAVGGVVGEEEVPRIRAKILMGAANNQLRATSPEEEIRIARALAAAGVLYEVDWLHNAAGVIAGHEAWERQEEASMERVEARVEEVCRDGVREVLRLARETGTTPTEVAYRQVEEAIYGAG